MPSPPRPVTMSSTLPKQPRDQLLANVAKNQFQIGNATHRAVPTGVCLEIPAGVTVYINPLLDNELMRRRILPQVHHGPKTLENIHILMINDAPTGFRMEPRMELASLEAVRTPIAVAIEEPGPDAADSSETPEEDTQVA